MSTSTAAPTAAPTARSTGRQPVPRSLLRWSHVALNCTDPAATEAFYRRWFGFHRARVIPVGDQQIVFLRHGEVYLELFQADDAVVAPLAATSSPEGGPDGPSRPGCVRHLAFQTDDVDAFLAATGASVPVALGPLDFDDVVPGWRSVWLLDPDGVVVEVSQGYQDQSSTDSEETTDD